MPKGQYIRKKKLSEMDQLDGKLRTVEELKLQCATKKPRTLDEIMGIKVTSKYKHKTVDEYTDYLGSLNGTDLQTHAQNIGIRPSQEVAHLKRSLIAEYTRYSNHNTTHGAAVNEKYNISPAVSKILGRGR